MAITCTAAVNLAVTTLLTSSNQKGNTSLPASSTYIQALTNGTSNNQVNMCYSDQRTLAASGVDALDMYGGINNQVTGATINFTSIKAIVVQASANNTNDVVVGGGTNPVSTIFGGTLGSIKVKPGGVFMITNPASGYGVTSSTADILTVTNSSSGTSVTYDIFVIGTV